MEKKDFDKYLTGEKTFFAGQLDNDPNSVLKFSTSKKKIIIEGNAEGLLVLAKYLIDFAYDDGEVYLNELYLSPSTKISLDALTIDSLPVYIYKKDLK